MNWDALLVIVCAVELAFNAVSTLWLYQVAGKAARIDGLEESVDTKAGQLIDAKFAGVAGQLKGGMERFEDAIKRIEARLERGDDTFDEHNRQAGALDRKLVAAQGELKTWAMGAFASLDDLHELRKSVHEIGVALARVEERR